ncbi:hypothetical protein D3C84_539110 [compost metagenome]
MLSQHRGVAASSFVQLLLAPQTLCALVRASFVPQLLNVYVLGLAHRHDLDLQGLRLHHPAMKASGVSNLASRIQYSQRAGLGQ